MKNVNIYLIILFLSSCGGNRPVLDDQILLSLPVTQTTGQIFCNNFEIETIIPIETTSEIFFARFDRVIFYKNRIIIADQQTTSVFVVDASTGKVETHIQRKGRGPGESIRIRDIAFDDRLEQILLFNNSEKLLYFALDGSFLKEEKIDGLFENIVYNNGKLIFYNIAKGYSCYPYSLSIYDLHNQSWSKAGKDQKVDSHLRNYGRSIIKSKNIWFTPMLDFGLHVLNDDEIRIPYKLDIQQRLTENLRQKAISDFPSFSGEIRERKILHTIASVRETDKFIIFKPNLSGFLMMNKEDSNLFWEEYVEDPNLGLILRNYFPHDGDDNRIMFVINADEWLRRSLANKDNVPEHLREKIDRVKVDEESNPVLIFYKEK
jgi:hypothetical protein